MSNIVNLDCITRLDIPAQRVIDNIPDDMDKVIVIGYTGEGEEYFASSVADGADNLWMIERAKHFLLNIVDEMCED